MIYQATNQPNDGGDDCGGTYLERKRGIKKSIIIDMLLNIIATAIPTIVLQLLILPSLTSYMTDDKYGLLITILALLNVVPSTIGNTLNNIRLIYASDEQSIPDFNALLIFMTLGNIVIISAFSWLYEKDITTISFILTLAVSIIWLMQEYYIVAFRIKIDYINVVISNVIMVLGYIVGFLVFIKIGHWQLIYILGRLFSLIFIFSKCNLWKEPIRISPAFNHISWQTFLLLLSNVLARITMYADKLLIFPILGGATVSTYYAATLFGKVVAITITPVSSVMLSYLSKGNKKNDHTFKLAVICGTIVCIIGYFICLAISRPVLNIIYPQYVNNAMKLIFLTTGSIVLTAMISIVNPFVLNFFDMRWQIIINGSSAIIYVILSMTFLMFWGLYGFCIGALITNTIKLILMIFIYSNCQSRKLKSV